MTKDACRKKRGNVKYDERQPTSKNVRANGSDGIANRRIHGRRKTHHCGGGARHPDVSGHSVRNIAEHRLFHADGGVLHLRRRGAMAHHRLSSVAFSGDSDLAVHGASFSDEIAVRHRHHTVFGRYRGRCARAEFSDAARRATHHGAWNGCLPAAADQHHSGKSSVPQAWHDAWPGQSRNLRRSGHRPGVRRIGHGIPRLALDLLRHDSVPRDFLPAWSCDHSRYSPR